MKPLKLVLTDHWFEEIKSGRKTHEYRNFTPYWENRLQKFEFSQGCFV
nr:MAG TPA: activating signal cointegrator [Caudoviricetes sp.]